MAQIQGFRIMIATFKFSASTRLISLFNKKEINKKQGKKAVRLLPGMQLVSPRKIWEFVSDTSYKL